MKRFFQRIDRDINFLWSILSAGIFVLMICFIPLDLYLAEPSFHYYQIIPARLCIAFGFLMVVMFATFLPEIMNRYRYVIITACFQFTLCGLLFLEHFTGGIDANKGYFTVIIQASCGMALALYKFPKLLFFNLTLLCGGYVAFHLNLSLDKNIFGPMSTILSVYAIMLILTFGIAYWERLQTAKDRYRVEFDQAINHELRGPLNTLINVITQLNKEPENLKELTSQMVGLAGYAIDALQCLNDLRTRYNKLLWGSSLNDCFLRLRSYVNPKHLDVNISNEVLEAIIDISPSSISTLMANLVNNAKKYADDRVCKIEATVDEDKIHILASNSLIDTSNFPDHEVSILELLLILSKSSTHKGVRLGLFLVDEIIVYFSGKAFVKIVEENRIQFSISLPLKKDDLSKIRFASKATIREGMIV